jgi:CRP/FNR family transcriptional regulator, cyclic AMP receptor protein
MQSTGANPPRTTPEDLVWLGEARRQGFFGRLPDDLVRAAVQGAQREEFAPGSIGLRWGDGPRSAIVLRGTLRTYLAFPDGGQATVRYLRPGDMTGIFAPRQPALARGLLAIEQSELLFIGGARMKELSLADPRFGWELVEEMTSILNAAHRALYIRAFGSMRQRVVSTIVERATAAGQLASGRQVTGTQHELAIAVGSVREVVASILGTLKHEGLIDIRRGGVVIVDPERLVAEAQAVIGSAS